MAGISDFFKNITPEQNQALLAAGSQILARSAPGRQPFSFGQAMGVGGLAFQDSMSEQQARQQQTKMHDLQIRGAEADLAAQERARAMQEQELAAARSAIRSPGQQAASLPGGPTAANAERIGEFEQQFDPDAYVAAMMQINPLRAIEIKKSLAKSGPEFDTKPQVATDDMGNVFQYLVAKDGTIRRLDGVKPTRDPNEPFYLGADGNPVANDAYQAYQVNKARAGATNVTTRVENKAAESIAAQVGPILRESATGAEGAVGQIDAANRVLGALNTNKIYAGPLATTRMSLAQFGQTIGIGGSGDAERIANTRQVIRGMAEMTLQGRKQMSGQGAITESESKLAERATSGDIDSLTPNELRIIAGASKRASEYRLQAHRAKVQRARNSPGTAAIADYFDAPDIPDTPDGSPTPNRNVRKYNPATGRIE